MRRRTVLAGVPLVACSGCLADARRSVSGDVRHDHSRLVVHDARERFVRGGLTAESTARFRAWLFPDAPPADETVFTDALGTDRRRAWDNEVHNENYDDGFTLLVQSRSPRDRPWQAEPGFPADPRWTGWRRVRFPFEFVTRDLASDVAADADRVVSTFLGCYAAGTAPRRGTVAIHEEAEGAETGGLVRTVDAHRWTPP